MSAKKYLGKVVSNKMTNTIVVSIEMPKRHPIYKKLMRNTKKIKAHTSSPVEMGAMVEIIETRPFSKYVSFQVVESPKEK